MRLDIAAAVSGLMFFSSLSSAGPVNDTRDNATLVRDTDSGLNVIQPLADVDLNVTSILTSNDTSNSATHFPVIRLGANLPNYAPPDFWNDRHRRPSGHGRDYEIMFCDRPYNRKLGRCDGECNYIRGSLESGTIGLFTPKTQCVIYNCEFGKHLHRCWPGPIGRPQCEGLAGGRKDFKAKNGMCAVWVNENWNGPCGGLELRA